MVRTVILAFSQSDLIELGAKTDPALSWAEIGYLSQWALDSERYAHCTISISHDYEEFTAVYRTEHNGPITYVIGAVWNGSKFGHHS